MHIEHTHLEAVLKALDMQTKHWGKAADGHLLHSCLAAFTPAPATILNQQPVHICEMMLNVTANMSLLLDRPPTLTGNPARECIS